MPVVHLYDAVVFRCGRAAAIAVGLVSGGAAGNVADRVFRSPGPLRGAVVDFVAIGRGPIFKAADVCVLVGVAILT